jgi:5-oxoprolinase (ATP-hydrolysing) subunit A
LIKKEHMLSIDLNCDLGEGIGHDEAIMPFISSANIACGYHAGDEKTMQNTILLCIKHQVAIGAHPSFNDKENFGRREINCSTDEVYELVSKQIHTLHSIALKNGARLSHVKPHGALYNMSAKNISIANAIARAVRDFDRLLILYGLSGSHSINEGKAVGLKTASEVFADRTYQDDGSLTSRQHPEALIENVSHAVHQVLQMIKEDTVTSFAGKKLLIVAQTICLHGDGKNAVEFARKINEALHENEILVAPPHAS